MRQQVANKLIYNWVSNQLTNRTKLTPKQASADKHLTTLHSWSDNHLSYYYTGQLKQYLVVELHLAADPTISWYDYASIHSWSESTTLDSWGSSQLLNCTSQLIQQSADSATVGW